MMKGGLAGLMKQAQAMQENMKKAQEQLALTDVFVIVSAESERQVGSIVDEVEDTLREMGSKPVRREGQREGRWVLIDFSDIVVHVQHDEERSFYELERLWKDCPSIDLGVVGTEQGGR